MVAGAFYLPPQPKKNMKKKITINSKEYSMGSSIRAMLIWETINEKPFDLKLYGDILLYYYCLLMAGEPELDITFEEFLEALESDVTLAAQFATALASVDKAQSVFDKESKGRGKGKKKD